MADCNKRLSDLSPSDAWNCFWQSQDWDIVTGNRRRMWENFTSTTIGEWGEIIFAFSLIPAQLASFLWPFVLVRCFFNKNFYIFANIRSILFGLYMFYAGLCYVIIFGIGSKADTFLFYQGAWISLCGVSMLSVVWIVGPRTKSTGS